MYSICGEVSALRLNGCLRQRLQTATHKCGRTLRCSSGSAHLCQQQEVIKQEAIELLAAFGFKEFAAVEELPGAQTVGDRVEDQLLKDKHEDHVKMLFLFLIGLWETTWTQHSNITSERPSH